MPEARVFQTTIVEDTFRLLVFRQATTWPFVQTLSPEIPTVSNVIPSVGSGLSTSQPWQADINGNLGEVIIFVSYEGLSLVEVAFDGDAFTPNFNGQSTVTQLAPAPAQVNRFVVRRNGGWPGSPRIFVRARTATGGVNT